MNGVEQRTQLPTDADELAGLRRHIQMLECKNTQLREALITHRADLHNGSDRPCFTCRKSADALGILLRVPNRCAVAKKDKLALEPTDA